MSDDSPDAASAEHVTVMERGGMRLRQCKHCHRLEAANSGEAIDHKRTCPHR